MSPAIKTLKIGSKNLQQNSFGMWQLPTSRFTEVLICAICRCYFVQNNDNCQDVDGFVNYVSVIYCTAGRTLFPLTVTFFKVDRPILTNHCQRWSCSSCGWWSSSSASRWLPMTTSVQPLKSYQRRSGLIPEIVSSFLHCLGDNNGSFLFKI